MLAESVPSIKSRVSKHSSVSTIEQQMRILENQKNFLLSQLMSEHLNDTWLIERVSPTHLKLEASSMVGYHVHYNIDHRSRIINSRSDIASIYAPSFVASLSVVWIPANTALSSVILPLNLEKR